MKKKLFLFFLLCSAFLFSAIAAQNSSFTISSSITPPYIDSWGEMVAGGIKYTVTYDDPTAVIYAGYVDSEKIYDGEFPYFNLSSGKKWNASDLPNVTKGVGSVNVVVRDTGDQRIYAVATKDGKSSDFQGQTMFNEVRKYVPASSELETLGINITNGRVSSKSMSVPCEVLVSLNEDMHDAIELVNNMDLPVEYLGQTAYFKFINVIGKADSDVKAFDIPGMEVPKPNFSINTSAESGAKISITIPDLNFSSGANFSTKRSVPESDVEVYYTLDGTDPIPGESMRYTEPFYVETAGTYSLRVIACYKGSVSEVAYDSWNPNFTIRALNSRNMPSCSVAGLVITPSAGNLYLKYDGSDNYIQLNGSILLDESFEGKAFSIWYRKGGYEAVKIAEYEVDTLYDFQEKYSNPTREFGDWIVYALKNSRGNLTGEYALAARWKRGESGYVYAVLNVDENNSITQAILSAPTFEVDINKVSFATSNPWAIQYNINGKTYTASPDVYNVNYDYSVTYKLPLTKEEHSELLSLFEEGARQVIEVDMQETLSASDIFSAFSYAGTTGSAQAGDNYLAYAESTKASTWFEIDCYDCYDALEYLKSVRK